MVESFGSDTEEISLDRGGVEHFDRSSESTRKQLVTNCETDSWSIGECGEESMELIDASTLVQNVENKG
jgi:hypothetical protein